MLDTDDPEGVGNEKLWIEPRFSPSYIQRCAKCRRLSYHQHATIRAGRGNFGVSLSAYAIFSVQRSYVGSSPWT